MKTFAAALAIAVLLLGVGGSAMAQQKPEDAIKYRQSAFFIMGQSFGPLAAMAKGDRPYDKEVAIKNATIVEFMSKLPWDRFGPGTDMGNTKAKPEIWENMDDFKSKAEKMQVETAKLLLAAQTGDPATLKTQVGETGKACKACHDNFRNK
jgi:cytochrome c556